MDEIHRRTGERVRLPRAEDEMSAASRSGQWIFFLIAGSYWLTVFLRSILIYKGSSEFPVVLGILFAWLVLFASEAWTSRKWPGYFYLYLALQTGLIFLLLGRSGYPDFFSSLFAILSMQIVLRLNPRIWIAWLGLCAVVSAALLWEPYESQVFALVLLYTAGNVFYGFYAQAIRKAEVARTQNLALAQELREANQKLQSYSAQREQLVVARERNRLARDLHDSVTQTVFSMTLTTQSASLLLERDPTKVADQLDRLAHLARSALSEMQLLISHLKPEEAERHGLASSLRNYLKSGNLPEDLAVDLSTEGNRTLDPMEQQGLFRIIQEALNNIVKHSGADRAQIRLHLAEPMWIEVEDQGQGFDLTHVESSGRVGLFSMHERAAEIGWSLQINTSPGMGTCIHAEKLLKEVRQP